LENSGGGFIEVKNMVSDEQKKRIFMDADIIIKNKEDIEYLEDKPGSIVRNALREGITL